MPTAYRAFAALLYYHLVLRPDRKYRTEDVAAKMGISPSTLYKAAQGEVNFSPDLISPLYNATKETEFLDFFIKDTDQQLVPRAEVSASSRSLESETLDVVKAVGDLSLHVIRAADDGLISDIEAKRIENVISDLHREIEGVRVKMRNGRAA